MMRCRLMSGRFHRGVDRGTKRVRAAGVSLLALHQDVELIQEATLIQRCQAAIQECRVCTTRVRLAWLRRRRPDVTPRSDPGNTAALHFETKLLPARKASIHSLCV